MTMWSPLIIFVLLIAATNLQHGAAVTTGATDDAGTTPASDDGGTTGAPDDAGTGALIATNLDCNGKMQ